MCLVQGSAQAIQQLQHQQAVLRDVLALGVANTRANAALSGQPVADSPLCNLVGVVLSLLSGELSLQLWP